MSIATITITITAICFITAIAYGAYEITYDVSNKSLSKKEHK